MAIPADVGSRNHQAFIETSTGVVARRSHISAGTLTAVSGTVSTHITGGTVDALTSVVGTVNIIAILGTITKIQSGTINTIDSVTTLAAGTLSKVSSGTINTVDMLSAGTVTTVGMVQNGTLSMLKAGTIDKVASGTIDTIGTLSAISGTVSVDTELPVAVAVGDNVAVSSPSVIAYTTVYTASDAKFYRARGAVDGLNSSGTGVQTAQIIGQFDDTSPTAITENSFGNVRISSRREVYTQIRDAAGNERGLNIDAAGNLGVGSGTLSMLTAGTVTTVGMVQAGTLDMLKAGTIDKVSSGTVNTVGILQAGTIDKLASGTVSTVSMLTAGTITTVAMVQAGTLDMLKAGSVTLTTLISGEDQTNNVMMVEQQYSGTHIAAAGTTTIKSAAGLLHLLTVNTAGVTGTITLTDGTAGGGGTIAVASGNAQTTLGYNYKFTTGLSCIIAAGTAPDITISYR